MSVSATSGGDDGCCDFAGDFSGEGGIWARVFFVTAQLPVFDENDFFGIGIKSDFNLPAYPWKRVIKRFLVN